VRRRFWIGIAAVTLIGVGSALAAVLVYLSSVCGIRIYAGINAQVCECICLADRHLQGDIGVVGAGYRIQPPVTPNPLD
jgi:hypothetical protein